MSAQQQYSTLMTDLQRTFVWLAKHCLSEKPKDVERFCVETLASKLGLRVTDVSPGLSREASLLQNDDVLDFVKDVRAAIPAKLSLPKQEALGARGYVSSEDSENGGRASSSSTRPGVTSTSFGMDVSEGSEEEVEVVTDVVTGKVTVTEMAVPSPSKTPKAKFFNRDVFTESELEGMVSRYVQDERMVSLFRAWDGDESGAVDFVELVMALHKFEDVARAGVDIKVAADALVEFVESDTERELKLPQFAKVIIVFAKNTFGKPFDEVADHMLKVASSTSEAAVLQKERGVDVTAIEAFDKEEQKIVRETAQCVSVNVENNISRLRQSSQRGNIPPKERADL